MKRLLFAATTVALVAAMFLPAAAMASNGALTTPFSATYTGGATTFTCSGANIHKTAPNVFNKDSETCLVSGDVSGIVAGTYSGDPWGFYPTYGNAEWQSDSSSPSMSYGLIATSWTATFVDNGNGTFTDYIVAYY